MVAPHGPALIVPQHVLALGASRRDAPVPVAPPER